MWYSLVLHDETVVRDFFYSDIFFFVRASHNEAFGTGMGEEGARRVNSHGTGSSCGDHKFESERVLLFFVPLLRSCTTMQEVHFSLGKGLEKVHLLVFCPRKVRKMTKHAEIAKNTTQTVFDPRCFHTTLGGPLGNRASN